MSGGEVNSYPIQLLVNYWEICPAAAGVGSTKKRSLVGERLDRLARMGVRHVATFVPWQAVESDISHALPRFLLAAAERKISVSLIVSPEAGVHYANTGLPKDLVAKEGSAALDYRSSPVGYGLPPNRFLIPSFFSAEFNKRYYGFLSRMDALLGDMGRQHPAVLEGVTIVLSGSFWKYNRSRIDSASGAFSGPSGDFSASATLAFRQRLEQYFDQREFQDPNVAAAAGWRARGMDEINRRWFYQYSEDVFRHRSFNLVRRRASYLKAREIELFTPEADPGYAYSHFLHEIGGGNADFNRLSSLVDDAATRMTAGATSVAAPFVHWCSLGGFRTLSDPEKQFLILKALLLMGSRGGGVLLHESEWFALSQAFRARAEGMARLLAKGELRLQNRVFYLTSHAWSDAGPLWRELRRQAGVAARVVTSPEAISTDAQAGLILIDAGMVITRDLMKKILEWLNGGRLVVLPRSPYFTEAARLELENLILASRKLQVDLGIPYQLHVVGSGKLVLYDIPNHLSTAESRESWKTFLAGMLSVADIEPPCRLSDSRMHAISLAWQKGQGLFVLNETTRQVAGDVIFSRPVEVRDFAQAFSSEKGKRPTSAPPMVSSRFSLEAAPCGILSLVVDPIAETQNTQTTQATQDDLRQSAIDRTEADAMAGGP